MPFSRFTKKIQPHDPGFKLRLKYISNLCRLILPPFNFSARFRVRIFDDQSLSAHIFSQYEKFINFGDKFPTQDEIYYSLKQSYEKIRKEFLSLPKDNDELRIDINGLFLHRERSAGEHHTQELQLRKFIQKKIELCDTFEKYLEFRKQLYIMAMGKPYALDTHDYYPD